jgi:hypothetical protein
MPNATPATTSRAMRILMRVERVMMGSRIVIPLSRWERGRGEGEI